MKDNLPARRVGCKRYVMSNGFITWQTDGDGNALDGPNEPAIDVEHFLPRHKCTEEQARSLGPKEAADELNKLNAELGRDPNVVLGKIIAMADAQDEEDGGIEGDGEAESTEQNKVTDNKEEDEGIEEDDEAESPEQNNATDNGEDQTMKGAHQDEESEEDKHNKMRFGIEEGQDRDYDDGDDDVGGTSKLGPNKKKRRIEENLDEEKNQDKANETIFDHE